MEVEELELPTRYVIIKMGIDEEGGKVEVVVRDDMKPVEEIAEIALRILREVNGKRVERKKDPEVV